MDRVGDGGEVVCMVLLMLVMLKCRVIMVGWTELSRFRGLSSWRLGAVSETWMNRVFQR